MEASPPDESLSNYLNALPLSNQIIDAASCASLTPVTSKPPGGGGGEITPPERIGISFNGGKDSVVMLELLIARLGIDVVRRMHLFVLEEANEPREMMSFRSAYLASKSLVLHLLTAPGVSLKDAFRKAMKDLAASGICSIFVGTRSTDPDGKRQGAPIAPCTPGWSKIVLYCPVYHWTYRQVWDFFYQM